MTDIDEDNAGQVRSTNRIDPVCDTCNGGGQIWDRGWYICPDCFGGVIDE